MKILNFLNENWETLVASFTTVAGFVTAIITYIKTRNWDTVKIAVNEYVKEAEKLDGAGVLKKEIVMAKIRTLCASKRIKFNEQKISGLVESVVTLTKTVNAREKDKIAEEK